MEKIPSAPTPIQIKANRFELLSKLANDLAHEVKNPLHGMLINLELVKRRIGAGSPEGVMERLRIVEQSVGKVHELVDGLLHLLRPTRNDSHPIEVDSALGEMFPLVDAQTRLNRVQASYEPAGAGALVRIPRDALKHAILNLVANSVEAMQPDGGRLTIRCVRQGDEIQIRVEDGGPGVVSDIRQQIFTIGFSTHEGRAGLGLPVARTLLEQASGRLELEDPNGHSAGATFLAAIPRASARA